MNMREADHEEIIVRLSAICQQKLHLRDNYGTSWQRLITFAA